ncbi:MAG TPA: hypothetical protein PLV58_07545 [Campylobacterales bacterium]|nr:hypothetical protein [Campylobacterales bacterium]
MNECEISYKTTSSYLQIFKNETKILRIGLNEYNGVKKVLLDNETIEVTFGDSKRRVYSLVNGSMMYEAGTNLCKLSKTDKKLRKQRYLSKLANEQRAS